jgi:flotillin
VDYTLAIGIGGVVLLGILLIPVIISRFLTTVEAGTIRLVTNWRGGTTIYKGPGKAVEIPVFTTGTTIPSKAINIDLDIADQTADVDRNGQPRPIKVRVLASAIVSVGDSNEMIKTAANRFFAKPMAEQTGTLTDLLTSTGRRAINLLHHDELFNSRAPSFVDGNEVMPVRSHGVLAVPAEDDDRLAIIIKSACSRELQDLGLVFNSLNIKGVQSEVAEARRRQSAVEAKANADIVQADQERRAKEAQLAAEQSVNDKQRDLEKRRAENAAIIATAEAQKQAALEDLRSAELRATLVAQAGADAQKLKIDADAAASAEAVRITRTATAQAEAIRQVNAAIAEGGDAYLTLRQLELVPLVAPAIANALAQAKLVNISSDGKGAAGGAAEQITSVIQTVLAAQLVTGTLNGAPSPVEKPSEQKAPAAPTAVVSAPEVPTTMSSPVPPPAISFTKPAKRNSGPTVS